MPENKYFKALDALSILIVDDMKSMRLTIRKMLQNLNIGSKLRFAENGKEGLEVLNEGTFDLAVIDWNMPVMNGIAMLENIRKNPELRDLPVIMVTAEAERDIVSEVAESEIDGYLLKPLTLEALDKKIKAVIDRVHNPDPFTLHRNKARELEEQGLFKEAIEEVKKALAHKPSASRMLRRMGLLHFKICKNTIAEKCLLKAVAVNDQDTISRVYLADYHLKKNELEKAGVHYLKILSLSTRYNDKAIGIGARLLKAGFRKPALDIFSQVIERSRKTNAVRNQVIDICMGHGEVDFPQSLIEQAIQENPANYNIVYKAGVIFLESGDRDKAMAHFINVDRHVRGHLDAKLQIARILSANKRVLQADDYLNQILRLDPGHKEAIELRKKI
ncbi:response regulator [Desulfobacter curvatus]|uniref:response regulator n=1 Tax=Desulfobacter curvatus TaxID=2290 RepID=UPI00037DB7F7|nr:response regulator [Desulfobacter curvatus]